MGARRSPMSGLVVPATVAAMLSVVAGCATSSDEAGGPATTNDSVPSLTEPAIATPQGFERTAARAVAADGTECELCLWVADTDALRRRGLMAVTDLGAADGMVFVYPAPRTGSFWMKDTLLPLSIGFYDAGGARLDGFDMEPCTADPCASYPTPADFTYAIEVEQGRLDELGLGVGSTFALLDLPCAD